MKKTIFSILFLLTFILVGCEQAEPVVYDYQMITDAAELDALIEQAKNLEIENVVFLDVRDTGIEGDENPDIDQATDLDDYADQHIAEFTVNIPYRANGNWEDGEELVKFLEQNYTKDTKFVIMCYSGTLSAKVFRLLVTEGYRNITDFSVGYFGYLEQKGDSFVPATGPCGCEAEE